MGIGLDVMERLAQWFRKHCDGDWEHEVRLRLENLDNPGWSLEVNLADTFDHPIRFERIAEHRSSEDWLVCWLEGDRFNATCGVSNLREMLELFVSWAESQEK